MAAHSFMVELGTPAHDFTLSDPEGREHSLSDFAGSPLLVMFLCNHCPYVQHVQDQLGSLVAEYQPRGLKAVGINSNDVAAYPTDDPAHMAAQAKAAGFTFPYLFDATQEVGQTYRAACTPDFFLYDAAHRLAYRGRLDASNPKNGLPNDGADLRAAIDAVLAGEDVPEPHHPSIGCSIKWRNDEF